MVAKIDGMIYVSFLPVTSKIVWHFKHPAKANIIMVYTTWENDQDDEIGGTQKNAVKVPSAENRIATTF